MELLTNIVAAEEDEIDVVGESSHPVDEWSGLEMRDLDPAKIVTLHCVLTGELFDDAVGHYGAVYQSSAEGAFVVRVADEAMERLVELDEDDIEAVATELAATEEFEYDDWEPETVTAMVTSLADLARIAASQQQVLLIWVLPLS